jgi:hypothetical protein
MATQYRDIPGFGSPSWRAPVPTAADLPTTNNMIGDVIVAQDTGEGYEWNGTSWQSFSGGGGGGGTVTSVALADNTGIFNITGSPITGAGTLTLSSLISQTANDFFAAPNGSNGAPTFRKIILTDLPAIASDTVLGNVTGGSAAPVALTQTQLTALVNEFTSSLSGAAPASGGGTSNYLRADGTWAVPPGGGSGTVTTVSVVSTNGFAGNVANATTTPAITIETTITGLLKGNGTAISAATAGTDYSAGTSSLATGILKSTTSTGALTIAIASDFPTLNQNTTGTAANITATSNTTLTSLPNLTTAASLALPFSQLTGNASLAQLPSIANNTVIGNVAGSTTTPTALSETQLTALVNTFTSSLSGAVPASGGGTTNFLRADGTFAAPAGSSYTFADSIQNSSGTITLVGDASSPGDSMYYGTNGSGTKGFYTLPSSSGTSTPTANAVSEWDGNVNFSSNSFIPALTTTVATGTGQTYTLTVTSTQIQQIIGTSYTSYTVKLPVATTLAVGQSYTILNDGSYTFFVNTSGGTGLGGSGLLPAIGMTVTCINPSGGTGAASWNWTTFPINGYGETGTVTSVALADGSTSPIYTISGSPVTAAGTLTFTLATQSANLVFAGPSSGSAAQPAFRALVNADVSGLTVAQITASSNSSLTTLSGLTTASSLASVGTITSGTWNGTSIAIAHGGTGQTTAAAAFNALSPITTTGDLIYSSSGTTNSRLGIGSTGQVLTVVSGVPAWAAPATDGTVTSVGLVDSTGLFTITGSPVTTSGSLTLSAFASQSQNAFLAGPSSGGAGAASFRAIAVADIPTLNQNTTGTAANVTGSSNSTLTTLSGLTTASSLASIGTITSGTWNGTTIAIAHGGTGQTTASAAFNALSPITATGDLIVGNGTNSATNLAIGSNGYVLTVSGGTAVWAANSNAPTTSYYQGYTGGSGTGANSFQTTSSSYATLTSTNTQSLNTVVSNGITVAAAGSNALGITITPASNTAVYMVTVNLSLASNVAVNFTTAGCQLYNSTGSSVMTYGPDVSIPYTLGDGTVPYTMSAILAPASTSAQTIVIQSYALGSNTTYAQAGLTRTTGVAYWTIVRIA